MIKDHDNRPLPTWMAVALEAAAVIPHWLWVYVNIGEPDECWPYVGSLNDEGYGRFRYNGSAQLAHRVIYALTNGWSIKELNKSGLLVRHECDVRACCNPRHLVAGSALQNVQDKMQRGRHNAARGADVNTARLTEEQVRYVLSREYYRGLHRDLAIELEVARTTIDAIRARRNWGWLEIAA